MAYEAGAISSTLEVDRDPWQAGLNQARREGRDWAKTRWTATLDADPKALDTALRKARSDLSGFGRQKYAAQLGVTFDDGGLNVAEGRLDAAASKRRELNLRAVLDGGAATLAELQALGQAADRLDGREIRMRAVLDGAPLVMSEAAAVDMAMDRLDGRNITMNVDLDGAAGLTAGLAGVEAARAAVDGKPIDVDTGPARRSIAGLIALYGTLATVASTAGIAAAGGLLGIGAGATAALPGIGAVALGFGGVTEAVKATTEQQQKQGQAAAKSGAQAAAAADAQRSAAASLANAERSLANARENARDGAIQAARAVTKARQQQAEQVAAAIDREQSAERTAARAWRDAARARGEINAALKTAKERMEDLAFQVAGGALAEERAVLNLQKAQEELNAARAAGVGGRELQELVLSYKEADLAVKQQAASNRRLTEEKRESDRLGVAGSKEVQAATERATDATERARDADRQVAQARAATAKARADGEARVTEAIEAQARQKRQADQSIAAAEASRESALRQAEAAQRRATEATSGGTAAVDKAREAMDKLSPAGQRFVRFLVGLEPKWRALRATAQEGLLPGVQSGIEALLRREPEINAFVGKYATAMGDLAQRTGEGLASEKWTAWFNWLGNQATPTIDRFGTITGNSLGGLAQLMKASSPLWYEMGDAIIRGTAAFERWATAAANGGSPGFNKFMDDVRTYGPVVWDTIVDIATAGYHVAESLAPAGAVALKFAQAVLGVIEAAPPGVILAVTAGIIGLAGAWKLLKVAAAVGNTWTAATSALSGLAGTAGSAAGGLRTLLTPSLLAATGPMQRVSGASTTLAGKLGASTTGAARFGAGIGRAASSLPLLGIAIAGVIALGDALNTSFDEGVEKMRAGGASAVEFRAELERNSQSFRDSGDPIYNWLRANVAGIETTESFNAKLAEQRTKWTDLENAQFDATRAQGDYDLAVREHGPASREAADAQGELARRTEDVKIANLASAEGIDKATAAMRNQTDEALAAADANLRKRQADDEVIEAQQRLTETYAAGGPQSKEYADAQRDLEQAQIRAASAAKASSDGQAGYNRTVADFVRESKGPISDTLQTLINGMDQAGLASIGARYEIDNTGQAIYRLPDGRTVKVDVETAAALVGIEGVQFALQNVPAGKQIEIDAMTPEAQEKLRVLGFDVRNLPNGHIGVTANDEQARNTLLAFQMYADWQEANPDLAADPAKADAAMRDFLFRAGQQTGVPALDADPARADATVRAKLGEFNGWHSTSQHHADTKPAEEETKSWWGRMLDWFRGNPVTPEIAPGRVAPGIGQGRAEGGLVGHLASGGPVAPWRRFPTGGRISGPGTGTSDDVPIMASNGEYVVRARSVRQPGVLPLLQTVNAMATGGVVGRYAAGGGIAAAGAAGGAAGAVAVPSGDPGAAAAAAASTDGLTASMAGAASAAGMLDPMLAQLAATQTGVLAPAQDAVTAGQQALVSAGIDPLAAAMTGTLAPALAGYGQQVGVDAPVANAALQGAQAMTQASTTATAVNTAANAAAMTGAVVGTSAAQQYEHGMIRGSQGATMGSTTALAQNTGVNTGAMTAATRGTSLAQQYEHGMIRNAQLMTGGSNDALAANTGQRSADMTGAVMGMSGQTQFHLGALRGAQGVTVGSTVGFADSWRDQMGRTVPDSSNPLRHVINIPIGGLVNAWNTIDSQFALGKHVNPPTANFAAGGVAGVMPGYTPGRDTMTIGVGGGEAVMRPEWTRAVGRDYIDDGNAAARSGGVSGVRRFLTGGPARGSTLQRLMGRYPLDDSPAAARGAHRWAGAFAYGGVAPHVAIAGDAVTRELGAMPGGIGGRGSRGNASDHPSGFALDFMTMSNMALGDRVAAFLQARAEPLAVKYLIWKQSINGGRGWSPMENRGSPTANHMDHVHASFEGGPLGGAWGDGAAGGGGFDFGAMIRDAFKSVFDMVAEVPRLFGPSDQVARAAGVPKAGAELAISSLMEKIGSMFAFSGGGNVEAFRPLVMQALAMLGLPAGWADLTLRRMNQESSGNPRIVNNWDSNARAGWPTKGLMQMRDDTFLSNWDPRTPRDIFNPLSNIVSSMRYTMGRYGSLPAGYNKAGGYDNGGPLPDDALALNTSGDTEMVLSTDQGRALGRRLDVDDRLGALVGGRGVVAGGDGLELIGVLEQMTQRMERAVASARQVVVYAAPGQSAESVAESTARREVAAQRTVRI